MLCFQEAITGVNIIVSTLSTEVQLFLTKRHKEHKVKKRCYLGLIKNPTQMAPARFRPFS